MLTVDKIIPFVKEQLKSILETSTYHINCELKDQRTLIRQSLLQVLSELFLQCSQQQSEGQKGKIAYFHFFSFRSSLLTGNYTVQASLFTKDSYLDPVECYIYWDVSFLMNHFEEDMKLFQRVAKENIRGFDYALFRKVQNTYYDIYLNMLNEFFYQEASFVFATPNFGKVSIEDEFVAGSGCYLGKAITIWPRQERGTKE